MSRAVERAFQLLQGLVKSEEPVGLLELARQANLDKSTAARLLDTLQKFEFARRNPHTKQYSVGLGLVALASNVSRHSKLINVVHPYLEALQQESGETVSFHVRVGKQRVCVDGVEGRHAVRTVLPLGDPLQLFRGTAAKAILAFLAAQEIEEVLVDAQREGLNVDHIHEQLRTVREQGFLAAVSDRVADVATVSAPVFNRQGVFAAITIAGPEERWTLERMEAFAPRLKEVSTLVSEGSMVYGDGRGS